MSPKSDYIDFYAGVGARATPDHVLTLMTQVARQLEQSGWRLRTGGAVGADKAFAAGVHGPAKTEFLPWPGYNNITGPSARPLSRAELNICLEIAAENHPAWHKCSPAARKLHARNVAIVAGPYADTPCRAMLVWTPGARVTGGSGTAIRIARHFDVPVLNLYRPVSLEQIIEFVDSRARGRL